MAGNKKISQLPTYTAIQDADVVPIVSTAGATTNQTTWANIKSVLLTYLNGFYATITGAQTLTNKTLTSPILNTPAINMGSDANGDILIRSGGVYTRLPKGSDTTVLTLASGLPSWVAPTTVVNADAATKGVVQVASAAQISAGTATGSTGASIAITPDQLALATPAFNGSLLTNIKGGKIAFSTTPVTAGNTSSVVPIATVSIPGGTLSTTNGVRIRIPLTDFHHNGSTSVSFILTYGATNLTTVSDSVVFNGTSGWVEAVLFANASTTAQFGTITVMGGSASSSTICRSLVGSGTSTETSTSTLNLIISVQYSSTNTGDSLTTAGYVVEKIY